LNYQNDYSKFKMNEYNKKNKFYEEFIEKFYYDLEQNTWNSGINHKREIKVRF